MLLTLRDYHFTYPDGHPALTGVDLALAAGSFTVMFGQSGSGKTTLLKQLQPALAPNGQASGKRLWQEGPYQVPPEAIGYVQQRAEAQFVTDRVWHELAFGLENLGVPQAQLRLKVAEMATFFGLEAVLDREPLSLSGGQKQLVNLASVMALDPALLLLDEPTAQLDPIAKQNFLQTLIRVNRDLGTTILIAEHELEDLLPAADQLVMMRAGQIVAAGAPQAVAAQLAEDPLRQALPAATRLYLDQTIAPQAVAVPLSIAQGRVWLADQAGRAAPAPIATEPTGPVALQAKHLWFQYAPEEPAILQDVNLAVHTGEWLALVGNNGAGKSTLISLLSRILTPSRGKVSLFGKPITRVAKLYDQLLAVLPQDPTTLFTQATVQAELLHAAERSQPAMGVRDAASGVAQMCQLEALLARHPYDLSGGEQQLLALAIIVLLRPQVLLLDEPTKGLDAFTKAQVGAVLAQLQAQGVTLIMVSHDLDFVGEHATRVGMLFNGQVVAIAETHDFFAANRFYTTAANRLARGRFESTITLKELSACLDPNS